MKFATLEYDRIKENEIVVKISGNLNLVARPHGYQIYSSNLVNNWYDFEDVEATFNNQR
jgi:hypothetical protein